MSGSLSGDPNGLANKFAGTSDVWKPRFQVFVGAAGITDPAAAADTQVTFPISAMVQKQNWYQADRHKIVCSLWADPGQGYDFWASFNTMSVLVKIAFEGALDYTEVFRGFVDKVQLDAIKGTVTLTGRNALGLLIDFHDVRFDTNATVGDILNGVFEDAGMQAPDLSGIGDVAGQTYGRFWPTPEEEQTHTTQGHYAKLNPMDIVVGICKDFGIAMYENEGVVHFIPETVGGDVSFIGIAPTPDYGDQPNVTKILSPSNCTSIIMEHDLNIAQWDWFAQGINYPSSGVPDATVNYPDGANPDSKTARALSFVVANAKPEDVPTMAQSAYNEFLLHEWIVTCKVAGPQLIGLDFTRQIAVQGTGTIIDGPYLIDSVEHQISFERGYVGTVRGRWGRT